MQTLQAAIFDIDGTLVDSVDLHTDAWQRAFRKFDREVSFLEIRSQIGKGGDQLLPAVFSVADLKNFGKELEAERGRTFQRELMELCGGFPKPDLRAAGAEAIFQDPADLLARYEESPSCQLVRD